MGPKVTRKGLGNGPTLVSGGLTRSLTAEMVPAPASSMTVMVAETRPHVPHFCRRLTPNR